MRKIIITIMAVTLTVVAQGKYSNVLRQIETNNSTLAALRAQMQAQKLANSTGITPENPEIEFNHLWGSAGGNSSGFSITQSFDFPTQYLHQNKITNLQNENAELNYRIERQNILLAALNTCVEITFHNALFEQYSTRMQNAESILNAYKNKLAQGETNVLEYNKAQLTHASTQAELQQIENERSLLIAQLTRLNGGKEISIEQNEIPIELPADFETWCSEAEGENPALRHLRSQIEIEKHQIKLNRANAFPKFAAGYVYEKSPEEHAQGFKIAMSIPLWENKNQIKLARTQLQAAEALHSDSKLQFYNNLQSLHKKAIMLQNNAYTLRQTLELSNNEALLQKALDAGEISLLTYLLEIEFYYSAFEKMLQAERYFEQAVIELLLSIE